MNPDLSQTASPTEARAAATESRPLPRTLFSILTRPDSLAIMLSLIGLCVAAYVGAHVFEDMPHLEDEVAYVWQARILADGKLTLPSPPYPDSFMVPFVVDYHGQRFGKYPLGWPLALAAGIRLGLRSWVNPLLAALGVWLTYRLGKRIFNAQVGLLAAALTVLSPFFMLNSGSLLSHPLGLVLSTTFVLEWLEAFTGGSTSLWPVIGSALALGGLAFTRPFTAVAISVPFAFHGLYLLVKGSWATRRRLLVFGVIAAAVASLQLVWQYLATGDPFMNLYTLWWSYDKVGFGPGHGVRTGGHTLKQAWINTRYSLQIGAQDLFGWGNYSWLFLPFGAWAARKNGKAWLAGLVFPSLVIVYLSYWIGASLFGPRYFYEGLFSLTIFSAAGILWLAGRLPVPHKQRTGKELESSQPGRTAGLKDRLAIVWNRWKDRLPALESIRNFWKEKSSYRGVAVAGILLALVGYNLAVFTPWRMDQMVGLYDMRRSAQLPFEGPEVKAFTPALIIVHPSRWMYYGVLLELEDPELDTPFIFAYSRGTKADRELAEAFPDRSVYHYYPDKPYVFYKTPIPGRK